MVQNQICILIWILVSIVSLKLLCICKYVSEGVRESGKHLGCIIQCLYPFFYPQFMGELTELSNLYHTGTGGRVIISLLGH